jgi:hypothetical protein
MANITIPSTLTVEEEDEFDPNDKYGDPIKKTVIVKFGDYEVARWEVPPATWSGEFYLDAEKRLRYGDPEEFLAFKLKKLFELIG